jgi:hypothetical protein
VWLCVKSLLYFVSQTSHHGHRLATKLSRLPSTREAFPLKVAVFSLPSLVARYPQLLSLTLRALRHRGIPSCFPQRSVLCVIRPIRRPVGGYIASWRRRSTLGRLLSNALASQLSSSLVSPARPYPVDEYRQHTTVTRANSENTARLPDLGRCRIMS